MDLNELDNLVGKKITVNRIMRTTSDGWEANKDKSRVEGVLVRFNLSTGPWYEVVDKYHTGHQIDAECIIARDPKPVEPLGE